MKEPSSVSPHNDKTRNNCHYHDTVYVSRLDTQSNPTNNKSHNHKNTNKNNNNNNNIYLDHFAKNHPTMQQTSRLQTIRSRFSPSNLRTSLRRLSSASTATSSSACSCSSSGSSSPVHTINAVLFRQPSILDMEEEKRRSGAELSVLEPRPIVYWGGLEERILGSL
ncbi:hypothetical protein F5Y12DRAFT_702 [Xylaria sp. FL1777]|nr:hypothetical protein F5Y12DRAFT_702 [Xylaria sp. FL1777]